MASVAMANNGGTTPSDQIRQMVNFILQEAHEKANEIRVKVYPQLYFESMAPPLLFAFPIYSNATVLPSFFAYTFCLWKITYEHGEDRQSMISILKSKH
jgi:hypothetical protein